MVGWCAALVVFSGAAETAHGLAGVARTSHQVFNLEVGNTATLLVQRVALVSHNISDRKPLVFAHVDTEKAEEVTKLMEGFGQAFDHEEEGPYGGKVLYFQAPPEANLTLARATEKPLHRYEATLRKHLTTEKQIALSSFQLSMLQPVQYLTFTRIRALRDKFEVRFAKKRVASLVYFANKGVFEVKFRLPPNPNFAHVSRALLHVVRGLRLASGVKFPKPVMIVAHFYPVSSKQRSILSQNLNKEGFTYRRSAALADTISFYKVFHERF